MISKIVAYVHLLHLAVLVLTLHKDVLEEVVVVLLHLLVGHIGQMGAVGRLGRVLRIDVEVGEKHGLGEGRLVVDPAAAIPVSAGALVGKIRKYDRTDQNIILPVLKKKEQFTLSFSVPKMLAKYSAIFRSRSKIKILYMRQASLKTM